MYVYIHIELRYDAMARVMEKRAGRRPSKRPPLPGTGRNMMPWLACAFVRAAHGHAKALRTWPLK